MKTVFVYPEHRVMGRDPRNPDTIIDPELDVLDDPDAADSDQISVFCIGEVVKVRFVNSTYTCEGVVTKIHRDDFGTLVQLSVDRYNLSYG